MSDITVDLPFLTTVLPVYLLMGLLGGLVNGLNPSQERPSSACRGLWVNTVTGGAASIAVLILVVNMFSELEAEVKPKLYLSLWSIGMVSGFMGMRFMNMMSEILGTKFGAISQKMDEITAQNQAAFSLFAAGEAYGKKQWDKALVYYNRALNIDPDNQEAKVGKAKSMFQTANGDKATLKQALGILDEVLAKTPDNDHALYHKAAILLEIDSNDTQNALALLEKADRINPAIGRGVQNDARFAALKTDARFQALAA